MEYSLLSKKHLSFAGARGQINTTLYQNLPEDTQNWTNLYLEPHDYRIYYVNIDLACHQYGISAAESQTFLRAKRPQRRRARRNGGTNECFRRLCSAWPRSVFKLASVVKAYSGTLTRREFVRDNGSLDELRRDKEI